MNLEDLPENIKKQIDEFNKKKELKTYCGKRYSVQKLVKFCCPLCSGCASLHNIKYHLRTCKSCLQVQQFDAAHPNKYHIDLLQLTHVFIRKLNKKVIQYFNENRSVDEIDVEKEWNELTDLYKNNNIT